MDMFLITKILDLAYVQNYMRCLSQNKSDTKLFRVYLYHREDSDKYTLTITYYNPFLNRQCNSSIQLYFSCLREIETHFKKIPLSDWR